MNIKKVMISIFAMAFITAFAACKQNLTEADNQSNLTDEPSVESSAEFVESVVESAEEGTESSSKNIFMSNPDNLTSGSSHVDEEDSEDEGSSKTNEYLGFTYELVDVEVWGNDIIEIKEFTGTSKDIVIPNEIDGHPVMIIGEDAFKDNKNIQSLTIPKNLKWIKDRAFWGCESLENIVFEEGSTFHEFSAECFFETAISEITIPATCAQVSESTFDCCYNLKKITILGKETYVYTMALPDDCVIRCYKDSIAYNQLLAAYPVKYNIEYLE